MSAREASWGRLRPVLCIPQVQQCTEKPLSFWWSKQLQDAGFFFVLSNPQKTAVALGLNPQTATAIYPLSINTRCWRAKNAPQIALQSVCTDGCSKPRFGTGFAALLVRKTYPDLRTVPRLRPQKYITTTSLRLHDCIRTTSPQHHQIRFSIYKCTLLGAVFFSKTEGLHLYMGKSFWRC